MKTFKDSTGKAWTININLGMIETVKALHGINLHELFADDMKLIGTLFDDPPLLANVLWTVCGNSGPVSPEFLAGLGGDELEAAANALIEDIIDFFPKRRRETLRAMVAKTWEIVDATQAKGREILTGIDPTSLPFATSSGASSGSTPEPSRPAS